MAKSSSKAAPADSKHNSTFPAKEEVLSLYRMMLLIRRFEEKSGQLYGMGLIGGFCHLHIGQEGSAAGCIGPLRTDDYLVTAYREHTQALAKGVGAKEVMAELYGRAPGSSSGKGGSMHIFGVDQGRFYCEIWNSGKQEFTEGFILRQAVNQNQRV